MDINSARNYPIEKVLLDHGIQIHGGFIPCPNPGHRERRGRNCSVYLNTNTFCCHACGTKGDVITLTMLLDSCSFQDAIKKLGGEDGKESTLCPVGQEEFLGLTDDGNYKMFLSLFYEDPEAFFFVYQNLKKSKKKKLLEELKSAVRRGQTLEARKLQEEIRRY